MTAIRRAPETMTAKERVRRTFAHEKTDRVTIGYETNGAVHMRLAAELGIPDGNMELVRQALGVDYRPIGAPYTGPQLHPVPPNRRVNQMEGCIMRWVAHETGGYWDFCDFPLKDAEDEDFAAFPIPDPDNFNYDAALDTCKHFRDFGLYAGDPGTPDIINSNGRIMGMEDILCHLLTGSEAALDFVRRRANFQLRMMERLIDKCKDYLDFVWLGEDLGTQHTPLISLELYRRQLKPIHKQFCDLAAAYNLPVIVHTCGSSWWAYEDFLDIGVSAVDTLQPEADGMSPQELKARFGDRLGYRGCISTAGPLAYGTPEQVIEQVKDTLAVMMPGGGYHFAPTHAIQDNSPTENVIAMYQAAHDFGRY